MRSTETITLTAPGRPLTGFRRGERPPAQTAVVTTDQIVPTLAGWYGIEGIDWADVPRARDGHPIGWTSLGILHARDNGYTLATIADAIDRFAAAVTSGDEAAGTEQARRIGLRWRRGVGRGTHWYDRGRVLPATEPGGSIDAGTW